MKSHIAFAAASLYVTSASATPQFNNDEMKRMAEAEKAMCEAMSKVLTQDKPVGIVSRANDGKITIDFNLGVLAGQKMTIGRTLDKVSIENEKTSTHYELKENPGHSHVKSIKGEYKPFSTSAFKSEIYAHTAYSVLRMDDKTPDLKDKYLTVSTQRGQENTSVHMDAKNVIYNLNITTLATPTYNYYISCQYRASTSGGPLEFTSR